MRAVMSRALASKSIVVAVFLLFVACTNGDDVISYRPFVVSTVPAHGATRVPVETPISINFSENMDPSTINESSWSIQPSITGKIEYHGVTATFTPSNPLDYSTDYTVVLANTIRDAVGDNMRQSYTFSFETAMPPPIITDFEPKTGYEGDLVAIRGTEFGSTAQANIVKLNRVKARLVSSSVEELVIEVPRNAFSGFITVTTGGGTATTVEPYSVLYHGLFWTELFTGIPEDINDIIYTGSQYVVVGDDGSIYTSPDLSIWSPQVSGASHHLRGVAYSGSVYVAVGVAGTILTSSDAVNWTPVAWPTDISFFDVCWGDLGFVAVGSMGTIITSTDGAAWKVQQSGVLNWLYGIAWAGARYVVVGSTGGVLTSPNFVYWYQHGGKTSEHLLGAGWSDSGIAVVGYNGSVSTSPNGYDWTRRESNTYSHLLSVTGQDTRMIACGLNGTIIASLNNGFTWTNRIPGTAADLHRVMWDGKRYVAVGQEGTLLISN